MTGEKLQHSDKLVHFTKLTLIATILVVLAFTPLGSIPLPVIRPTTTHIPVIIGGLLLGYKSGLFLGVLFGCVSVIRSTIMPALTSFAFSPFIPVPGSDSGSWSALIVAFIPRMLVGVIPPLLYQLLLHLRVNKKINLIMCGIAGSLVNTIFVLSLIYLLFGEAYAQAIGVEFQVLIFSLLSVVTTNGLGEAIVSAILVPAICIPLMKKNI